MSERNELFDQLKRQNESQFEELLLRLKVDKSHIRWSGATLSQKALDLIGYLEQQEDGLQRLQERLEREKPDDIALILACPYRELFAFQEEHAEFFFGRSGFINDLVQAVKTKPLVAVVGASGSGKSSLVFAGLLPRLRQEGSWLIESFRPEKQPFNRLAAAFVHQLEPELGKSDRIDKAINLANTIRQHGFAYVLSEILQEHPGKQLLLVVDQFEELYTVCSEEERDRFIDILLAGINDSLGLKVVLTLRADFCGQAYTCRSLADALQSADLKLGSMNGEELREAIERPAQLMEVELEEKLTERLLEDVKQEPGNLPLLEFALTELWKKQRQRRLTHQAYAEIGGVAKALANHAETVVDDYLIFGYANAVEKNFTAAQTRYSQALELAVKNNDLEGQAIAQSSMGEISAATGNLKDAVSQIALAKDTYQRLGNGQRVSELNQRLVEINKQLQVNPSQLQIDPARIQIDPARIQIDPARIQIDPSRIQIDPSRLQIQK
jgi:energy-coupling factor transporter ATP-binding protein EcfA2